MVPNEAKSLNQKSPKMCKMLLINLDKFHQKVPPPLPPFVDLFLPSKCVLTVQKPLQSTTKSVDKYQEC